jgi:hypothetical protein
LAIAGHVHSARKLSVITPVVNGAATLPGLLERLEHQQAVPVSSSRG